MKEEKKEGPVRVLFIQRRLPRYRMVFFNQLRARLREGEVELDVVHGLPDRDERARKDEGALSWGTCVPGATVRLGGVRLVWQRLGPARRKKYALVVIPGENSMLSNYLLLLRRGFAGQRLAFFGHGANFQEPRRGTSRERVKAFVSRRVDWWFAYTSLSVQRLVERGFPRERITCVNNAVDTRANSAAKKGLAAGALRHLRKRLGLQGETVGLFLGSLTAAKRLDVLFAAADAIRKRQPDFELLIVGDGPERGAVEAFAAGRKWVRPVGAQHGPEKVALASLADVMLNPGMVGLGILDGFSLGLPLVTTDCGTHSPEIAYLEPGRNGLMAAPDVPAFVEAASSLLADRERREEMGRVCLEDARRYTVEKMVENFVEGIQRVIASPPFQGTELYASPRRIAPPPLAKRPGEAAGRG